jgi:alkyl hydroperoxide reductase subunit AhpC
MPRPRARSLSRHVHFGNRVVFNSRHPPLQATAAARAEEQSSPGCELDVNVVRFRNRERRRRNVMSLVGKKAPEFTTEAVVGDGDFKKISLSDYKGKYVVLFFYPADFTFICPTEIQEFSRRHEEFKAVNCEILGASTDSKHSHKAWIKGGLGKLNHPLLADFNKTIARDYEALMDDGMALRATIIIDPQGIVQHASYNADLLGRSVSETLRLVQALQTGERCPVEWKPGQKTLGKPA